MPSGAGAQDSDDVTAFLGALKVRRDLVYDYLDHWSGADNFKPRDIHDALFSYVRHRGKGLRPSLLLFCCGAVGGDEAMALPAAAAVEIFHIWTLVHDDIIDRDDTRRGSPTVHALYAAQARDEYGLGSSEAAHYGTAVAILAGDLQQSWAYGLLTDLSRLGVSPAVILKLVSKMAGTLTPRLLEGEMLDVQFAFAPRESLSEDDVLYMLGRKTASLLEFAAWAGATIGLGEKPDVEDIAAKLGRFASLCGIAFQLQDDLLGLTADEVLLGKPVGSDIREGKRTLVVCRALGKMDDKSRNRLLKTLGNVHATNEDVDQTLSLIEQSGTYEDIRGLANSFISQAVALVEQLPEGQYKAFLRSWASFMLSRSY